MILREEDIENYKAFKKSYTNENNGLTVIGISSEENNQEPEENIQDLEENIQDSEMTQGENKEVVKYDESKTYYDWSDKTLRKHGRYIYKEPK